MTMRKRNFIICLTVIASAFTSVTFAQTNSKLITGACLEITLKVNDSETLKVNDSDGGTAECVCSKCKQQFLKETTGAVSKEFNRTDDVQVHHCFKTPADVEAYLKTDLFNNDFVSALKPYLQASPDERISFGIY